MLAASTASAFRVELHRPGVLAALPRRWPTTGIFYCLADRRRDRQIVTITGAVPIHTGQHNFASPEFFNPLSHWTASRPVGLRPPLIKTSQNS